MSVKSRQGLRARTGHRDRHAFQRDLTAPGLILLTLGGIMGSGLFLASGLVIRRSGPATLWVFVVAAVAMTLEIWALSEMAAADPEPGSFLRYAERVYGPGMTFVAGWVFWFSSVLTMSSEVTAAALFTRLFWPGVAIWVWSLVYSAGIVLANFVSVRGFGTIEGIMAGVKVGAVLAFLVLAALYLTGVLAGPPGHLASPWGHLSHAVWWPTGLSGPASSLILVLFAFAGTGVIGLAAGETKRPPVTIGETLGVSVPLVWLLYLGSVVAIMGIIPWHQVATTQSPFVQAVHAMGLPMASRAMDVVLIFAVLSTMNAALYSNSRVLYSLGRDGLAPAALGRLNRKGIPVPGILWSTALLALTIVLAYFLPKKAYSYLVTATGFQAMFIWGVVLVTHLRYRRYLERRGTLRLKLIGYPWTTYLALALVAVGMAGAPLARGELVGLVIAAGFIAVILVVYLALRRHLAASHQS
jgi:L-asparagine transporter-like permease